MARLLKIYQENPNPKAINQVVDVLKSGGLIIYPTDTVYGLGCDISNSKALEKLARLKGIKLEKANWSFICADLSNLSDYARQLDSPTFKLLKRALPGPYTFILPGSSNLPRDFKRKKTVGIRVPDHSIPQAIVTALGHPIVSTSIHDEDDLLEYTTDPELIYEKWKDVVDLVIDGGYGGNIASTIIDLSGNEPELIREGKGELDILN
jgi:tRNA threonylcarbamoyl adenosine modification protein (Sua5/YciO/YrdC/YwlC family)